MTVTFHKTPKPHARGGKRVGGLSLEKPGCADSAKGRAHITAYHVPHNITLASAIAVVYAEVPENLPYVKMASQTLYDESRMVKCGMRSWVVKRLAKDLNIEISRFVEHLAIPRSTYHRKYRANSLLNVTESERVLGVAKLVGQVKAMLAGNEDAADFDAAAWVGNWLEEPLPAIGNERPIDLMDTAAGQELVSKLLLQAQTGAYA